ncbi:exocyst complex component EXO84C [Magnolia sinica]|uniref:exocyst complex component EXO84C n=1 Tax=Magnolia sinica TaxID=86752 RepID=UPI00265AE1DF|nr:exocyst complex component EXO84C [Magnolia sinica]
MESSSEEEDDFPTHECITPQSKINSIYQSHTERGIRKLCSELLDLKDAVENLCGNMHSKYLAFLRISEEVIEMEHELIDLQKHISAQGILVQDLMSGVCRELELWHEANNENCEAEQDLLHNEADLLHNEAEEHKATFLERIDVLLAEHKIEEAISALDAEEKSHLELIESGDDSSTEVSSYKVAFLKRKVMLADQLFEIAEQPSVSMLELKKALSGLLRLGRGPSAHQFLLKAYGSRLQKDIEAFLPSCSIYSETYAATLSQLVFSTILLAAKESTAIFGDVPMYTNRLVQWAEWELESFVHLVKENMPSSESGSALRAASICVQASLSHCSMLESQGLKFSKLLIVLLHPYVEEVLEMNFRRARKIVVDLAGDGDVVPFSPQFQSPLSAAPSSIMLTNGGQKFMSIVRDILEQLTPVTMSRFGGTILQRLSQLFDKYIDTLIKALPGPSEDDILAEQKENIHFRAETDAQQLALLGTAFTVADELLPMVVSRICGPQSEGKEPGSGPTENTISSNPVELKDWKRQLQHALDKIRDHFCRQYVLNFIYSREGKTRLDAHMYLNGKAEDLFWDSDPLPSLPFQALFAKLQQLAIVAGHVLLGKEKIQKILLSRVTETVVMWLSDEQEFWGVFEDDSARLQPFGLQQLILDMHFIVEIAVFGGYPSRHVHQIVSAIIARAIRTFSVRGIDPQSALPEDEWFVDTAKAAINKLLLRTSGSESSESDEDHMVMHDEISDSDDTISTLSSGHSQSAESFASANCENESPVYLTDPES